MDDNSLEKAWDLKKDAHNNIFNYLETKGLKETEMLQFTELLKEYSNSVIKFNSII